MLINQGLLAYEIWEDIKTNEEDVEEFLENFKNGVYKDEAERSLDYVRTSGVR